MSSQSGGAVPPYWTEWEFDEGRQLLRRELRDYRGRVLREQFGKRPPVPRQSDTIEAGATNEYRDLTNTGAVQSSNERTDPWEGHPSENYGHQSSYASPPPNPSSSQQYYPTSSTTFGSESRFGFPAAQNAQTGYGGGYGASNLGPAASGYQASLGRVPQHQQSASGLPMDLARSTPQPFSSQAMQYSHSTESSPGFGRQIDQYGSSSMAMGSPGNQYFQGTAMRENTSPYPTQQYPNPSSNFARSGLQTNPATTPQGSYAETFSISPQDEMSPIPPPAPGNRRQSMSQRSRGLGPESNVAESGSETQVSQEAEYDSDATAKMPSSQVANLPRGQKPKTYPAKERSHEGRKSHRSGSRAAAAYDRSSSQTDEPLIEVARNLGDVSLSRSNKLTSRAVDQQTYPPTSPRQDSKELQEPSTRIPPRGYDRPEDNNQDLWSEEVTETTRSRRRDSVVHRHDSRPTGLTQRHDSKTSKDQAARLREKGSGNKDTKKIGNPLDKEFQVHPSKDFKKGRVLMTLWSEPKGSKTLSTYNGENDGNAEPSKFGEMSYNSVRRFVVVKKMEGHALCVPILTYGGRGTAKPGVKADDHAMIHTSKAAPQELVGEEPLLKKPVRMESFSEKDKLAPASRVNYSKIYTIEHNIKVNIIGKIHKDSEAIFFTEVKRLFDDDDEEKEESKSKKGGKRR